MQLIQILNTKTGRLNKMSLNLKVDIKNDDGKLIYAMEFPLIETTNIFEFVDEDINVDCKIAYTTKQQYAVDGLEYRIYGKASDIEVDVIEWTPVERGYNENFFLVDTKELAPGKYFIAIKVMKDMEEIIHRELCEFDILDNKKDLRG